ncbi:KEOPS complex subunit Cgi121 [Methanoplanus endosymbiosus]|uniref:Uncharacterized protein n=1 Tax=Methanoplanus endosymbiosus TaxID=33865 RepID=A0A9E7TGK3_9EURY|nr:KEOPS complex subunit Cgi121 [Methanoplanus endosymbiosus]UUX91302.1 hypothetical protein L6E24_07895 [Methanoplanus endosymbiosus]
MKYTILQAEVVISDEKDFLSSIRQISVENDVYITFFDADYIAGKEHIESAFLHGLRAFYEGDNISRTPDMEVLLYAAGTRQCSCAVKIGLKKGVKEYYILIFDFLESQKISDENLSENSGLELSCSRLNSGADTNKKDSKFKNENSDINSDKNLKLKEEKFLSDVPDFFLMDAMPDKIPFVQRYFQGYNNFLEQFAEVVASLEDISCKFLDINLLQNNISEKKRSDLFPSGNSEIKGNSDTMKSSEGKSVKDFFEITEKEILAAPEREIVDFVLERVALLEISK